MAKRLWKNWHIRLTRDAVLFVVGILGIIHETIISKSQRPELLVLFAGMVGLPAFLRTDEAKQNPKNNSLRTQRRLGTFEDPYDLEGRSEENEN